MECLHHSTWTCMVGNIGGVVILTISKKVFFLFCLVLCAVAFCAGFCVHKLLPEETHTVDADAEDVSSMDAEHDRRIAEAESNAGICEINEEFAQRYAVMISDDYERILSIADNALKPALTEERSAWEKYARSYMDSQLAYYEQFYTGGSIVPVVCSKAEYDLYRQKALSLREMYDDLARMIPFLDAADCGLE